MIPYATFVATLAANDVDLDALAIEADVTTTTIHAVMNGRIVPTLDQRDRLARALGAPAAELFAVLGHVPGEDWFITDPTTLRLIDRRAS